MYGELSWVVRPTDKARWEIHFAVPQEGDILCASMEEAVEERARCNRWVRVLARLVRRYSSVPARV